jgi:hypothetical protein
LFSCPVIYHKLSHLSKIDFEIEKGAYNQVIDSSPKEINPERRCTLGE